MIHPANAPTSPVYAYAGIRLADIFHREGEFGVVFRQSRNRQNDIGIALSVRPYGVEGSVFILGNVDVRDACDVPQLRFLRRRLAFVKFDGSDLHRSRTCKILYVSAVEIEI